MCLTSLSLTTLSVFKYAQYYFSRGLKFARFEFAHPKYIHSRGLDFAHLTMDLANKFDQNSMSKGYLSLRITNKYCYQISTFLQTTKNPIMISIEKVDLYHS